MTSKSAGLPIDDTRLFAETSPVYVIVGGKPIRSKQSAEYFPRWVDAVARAGE